MLLASRLKSDTILRSVVSQEVNHHGDVQHYQWLRRMKIHLYACRFRLFGKPILIWWLYGPSSRYSSKFTI